MYSKHNKEKSVVAERFIRTLQNKIYKHITSVSKDVYIDKLDEIVNEYNYICHRTPVDQLVLNIILVLTLVEKLMIKIPN